MAAQDGKTNPFDGTGGSPGAHDAYQKAIEPKGTPPGDPRSPEMVAPGGPLPFQPAPARTGHTIGAGSPGQSLPVKLGG